MTIPSFLNGVLNVAGAFVPGIAAAAKVVTAFLPEDQKLDPQLSTGKEILTAYDSLNTNQKASIDKQFEVELAEINGSVNKLQAMVSAETASGNTRPLIALMMALAVFIAVVFMMIIWGRAVWVKDAESLKQLVDSWPLMLTILGTPTALLRAYFGMRTQEKHARYAAATGQPIADAVGGLMKIFNKK